MDLNMSTFNLLVLLLLLVWSPGGTTTTLHRKWLTEEDGPDAVCNDGSPAAYYHSSSSEGRDPGQFVIFLKGGYFCASVSDCLRRCTIDDPDLCSTSGTQDTIQRGGILSDDPSVNKALAGAYKAFLWYCTSDMFIGDRAASYDTGDYHFRGKKVFAAFINSLKRHTDLGSATEVILTGTSAGGRGAAYNSKYLQTLLPDAQVKCIVDAAILYPALQPFNDKCTHFNDVVRHANNYWNGDVTDFDVDSWWRTFDLPLFIGIQMFDEYGLFYFCINPQNTENLKKWFTGLTEVASRLAKENPSIGMFIPACFDHAMIPKDPWYSQVHVGKEGITYGEAIANWLAKTPPYQVWDECPDPPHCEQRCLTPNTRDEL